jgi:hypothetical protein
MAQTTQVTVRVKGKAKVSLTIDTRDKAPPRLSFQKGNAKLGSEVATFSLPAGHTCPGALECLSKAARDTGKIADGPQTVFRCFSASQEATYPSVRQQRWRNQAAMRGLSTEGMVDLILSSLPARAVKVRIHVSGDFFSQDYFDAWAEVARRRPEVLFYAYTKSVHFWVKRLGILPANLVLTASKGGRHDELIERYGLRQARVVFSEAEAESLGLPIDHDDSHAMRADGRDFALLLHGQQPAGSAAARAIQTLRKQGEYGYGERADAIREGKRFALAMA